MYIISYVGQISCFKIKKLKSANTSLRLVDRVITSISIKIGFNFWKQAIHIFVLIMQGIKFDWIRGGSPYGSERDIPDKFESIIQQGWGQSREDTKIWFRLLLRLVRFQSKKLRHSNDDLRDTRSIHPGHYVLRIQFLPAGLRAERVGKNLHHDRHESTYIYFSLITIYSWVICGRIIIGI